MPSGWSAVFLPRAAALMDAVEGLTKNVVAYDPKLAFGPQGANQASDNHVVEAWSCELLRAALWGTPEQFATAKQVALEAYFPRDLGIGPAGKGLWAREQGCPDPHGGQHLVGTLSRVAAVISGDADLLAATGKLLCATTRFLRAVAPPDCQVWTAGMRDGGGLLPSSTAATAWLRQLRGVKQINELSGKNAARNWAAPFFVGARAIRFLQSRHDDFAGAANEDPGPTPLHAPMTVYRGTTAHLVVIPKSPQLSLTPQEPTCDWLLCPWIGPDMGKTGKAVTWGTDWTTPPPAPPDGATVIQFPSVFGGG